MIGEKKLRGILIDPTNKSITEVYTGAYPDWMKNIEVDTITAVTLHHYDDGQMETLWIDDEGLLNEKKDGPYIKVKQHPQPLAGKGIIFRTDQTGETISTTLTVEDVEGFVSWPNVHFTGLQPIPEHREDHPLFGDVLVTGSIAEFEDGPPLEVADNPLPEDEEKGE